MRGPHLALCVTLLVGCSDGAEGEATHDASAVTVIDDVVDLGDTEGVEDATPHGGDGEAPDCTPSRAPSGTPDEVSLDPAAPPAVWVTVNEVPESMNGTLPWTDEDDELPHFLLRVNRERFTLDVMQREESGPVDWDTLALSCDQPLGAPDGGIWPAGTLLSEGDLEAVHSGHLRLKVTPDTAALPDLEVSCSVEVSGPNGADASTVVFETATLPPELDPFVTPDTWLVVLSRDIFSLEMTVHADDTATLVSTHVPEGDGVVDFDEAFVAMGLFSDDNPEATAFVKGQLLEVIRDWAHAIFLLDADGGMTEESVPIQIFFEGDPGAPNAADFDGSFSMIALGGDGKPHHQTGGLVGMASLDPNNQGHEDNTLYGRGVYPTGVVRQALGNPLAALLLASILPHTGTPIGDHPADALFLNPDFVPDECVDSEVLDRHTVLALALEFGGLALGATLAHEIGHSLGLVPPGPPPGGLFAGMKGLAFTDHTLDDSHIDTPGLNIMQTGKVTNWMEALSQAPRFNALNLAYLRRRLVVGP